MSWSTPLVNRNQRDIHEKNTRAQWNATDMNRVNGNILALAKIAGLTLAAKTDYKAGDFIHDADFAQMLANVNRLAGWWQNRYPPTNPDWYALDLPERITLHYEVINRVERLLLRMYRIWQGYIGPDIYAGEPYVGEI